MLMTHDGDGYQVGFYCGKLCLVTSYRLSLEMFGQKYFDSMGERDDTIFFNYEPENLLSLDCKD